MTQHDLHVVVVGPMYCDVVFADLPRIPALGEEVATDRFAMYPGGSAITAVAFRRLGVRTTLVAAVGDDALAELLLARLRTEGVETEHIHRLPSTRCGVSAAVSVRADRFFVTYEGVNENWDSLLRDLPAILRAASPCHHVHVAGPHRLRALVQGGWEKDATVSLDIGWIEAERWRDADFAILAAADVFLPNEREALRITGAATAEQALWTLRGYVRMPVIKLGPRGAMALENNSIHVVPPPAVDAVDTVGAGDAFDAGFLLGWLRKSPLLQALHMGVICGAYSTRAVGGLDALPTWEEVLRSLPETEGVSETW
ncbi:MAG: carbohydrate kinase family protein [Armatimonadota bacterium]|nr:carbohydrate kinase family protein [Armatimonadota bacterium]